MIIFTPHISVSSGAGRAGWAGPGGGREGSQIGDKQKWIEMIVIFTNDVLITLNDRLDTDILLDIQ